MIYLHCGLHKTGTTTFQYSCIQNRHLLHLIGIDYPEDPILTIGSQSHLALARDFNNSLFLIDQVVAEKNCDLLLSCEELINSFDNFNDSEILSIFNELDKKYNGLNLIITIRDERELATSLLKEYAEGSSFQDIDFFLVNYKNKISRILKLGKGFRVTIIDMNECPQNIPLSTYYLKSICGKIVDFTNIKYNTTKSKIILYYFLNSFRNFYSAINNCDKYSLATSVEISKLYGSISLDKDYEIYLNKLFEDFIDSKVNDFFKENSFSLK